jgi:hypothetical protein
VSGGGGVGNPKKKERAEKIDCGYVHACANYLQASNWLAHPPRPAPAVGPSIFLF